MDNVSSKVVTKTVARKRRGDYSRGEGKENRDVLEQSAVGYYTFSMDFGISKFKYFTAFIVHVRTLCASLQSYPSSMLHHLCLTRTMSYQESSTPMELSNWNPGCRGSDKCLR